jgi:hypothetical protein
VDPRPASGPRTPRPSRRRALRALGTAAAGAAVLAGATGSGRLPGPRTAVAEPPLLSRTVAFQGPGRRILIGAPGSTSSVVPGTRLVAGTDPDEAQARRADAFLERSRPWIGTIPERFRDLATSALLDLWVLSDSLPAPVAGWSSNWRYIWPRDTAFCALALARTGHRERALDILAHLQDLQSADGWFEARFSPTTGIAPDPRPRQFDGTGLALWSVGEVLAAVPAGERGTAAARLRGLVTTSRRALLEATADGTRIPPASPDYWEVRERRVTLGIMASTLAGLRASARIGRLDGIRGQDIGRAAGTGDPRDADDEGDARAAAAFQDVLVGRFGPAGYQRYARGGGADSALAFLDATGCPGIVGPKELAAMAAQLARPAGGIAPGARWKRDGISWTPSTSLLGLALASTGDADGARSVLAWLDAHRTSDGSLPEKVLHDGRPAAVAPLAWSAANVLLTIDALGDPRP